MTVQYFVTKSPKSLGIAILLTFLFGPLGLFYASISGGLIMTFTPILLFVLVIVGLNQDNSLLFNWSFGLLLIFALTYWLINIIWAVISVINYNEELEDEAKRQYELLNSLHETTPNHIVVNINQKPTDANITRQPTTEISAKPNLQDWLKSNPNKSINDYYAKFGI